MADTVAINKLIRETEVISITPQNLTRLKISKNAEGVYYSSDSTYKIAIIKNKTSFRDYAGVILTSKSSFWKPGQVKMELKQTTKSAFKAYYYSKDHSIQVLNYSFDGKSLNNGDWTKEGIIAASANTQTFVPVQFKSLSDRTSYIRIGTFDEGNSKAIDSVFKANESSLKSKPNLILDLRGNGGGADFAFYPILPYLYTNPIYNIGTDVLATDDNIKSWLPILSNNNFPQSTKDAIKNNITKMQEHIGRYVSLSDDDTTKFEKIEPYPQKIVILIDNHCASTTEQLLLTALQSKKVTLMGQRTAGVLDHASVRSAPFPCSHFTLYYATTRSRRIDQGKGIDDTGGIKPNIVLPFDQNWITEATKYLEK
ncbi:S41 family peptidase [Mucilaginibacter sp. PPCGB 2223]|uniref:S41 family peptidase n=1 Tax=Mucilaginibacter sp. PPCGB 2223 TaxID=1886027 RepID=UPI00158657A6|nr:S41 family peptidase [Mucilaginibacter sp. PPCGB 2223]